MQAVGVKELGWEHLARVLEHTAKAFPERLADSSWLAAVLTALQQCMAEGRLPQQAIKTLQTVPMFAVHGSDSLVAIAGSQVYFPPSGALGNSVSSADAAATAARLDIHAAVQVLRPELLDHMAQLERQRGLSPEAAAAQPLLRQLGAQTLTVRCLVEQHLVPQLVAQEDGDDPEEMMGMLSVVRQHFASLLEADQAALAETLASSGLQIVTTCGVVRLRADGSSKIYLSSQFGSGHMLPSLLTKAGLAAVAPGYLTRGGKAAHWRAFFSSLGIRERLTPIACERKVSWEDKAKDPVMAMADWGPAPATGFYLLEDWTCPEIQGLLVAELTPGDRKELITYLDATWDAHFRGYSLMSLVQQDMPGAGLLLDDEEPEPSKQQKRTRTHVPSTLVQSLRDSAWLPAAGSGRLHSPRSLFNMLQHDVERDLRMLKRHLPVLDPASGRLNDPGFRAAIGLERPLSAAMLLDALRCCASNPDFKESTAALQPVYYRLMDYMHANNTTQSEVYAAAVHGFCTRCSSNVHYQRQQHEDLTVPITPFSCCDMPHCCGRNRSRRRCCVRRSFTSRAVLRRSPRGTAWAVSD